MTLPTRYAWMCPECGYFEWAEFGDHWKPGVMRTDICGGGPVRVVVADADSAIRIWRLDSDYDECDWGEESHNAGDKPYVAIPAPEEDA